MSVQRRPPPPPRKRAKRSGRSNDERTSERIANLALRAKRLRMFAERVIGEGDKAGADEVVKWAKGAVERDNELRAPAQR